MSEQEPVFKIIHNFRKQKPKKRHHLRSYPPSSIQTRHMSAVVQSKQEEENIGYEMINEIPSQTP